MLFRSRLRRECRFAELDIAPAGVVDTARASQPGGLVASPSAAPSAPSIAASGAVGQLEAVAGKET